jgi:pimeloyl-ACP methyl ester carboxylesterase
MTDTATQAAPPETLVTDAGVSIAYHRTAGKSPGVVFMGGFMSDMTGTKALALEAFCRDRGHAFLRFDYRGHGASSGRFQDGTISRWLADALAAFDNLTDGPQVVVGSSMGGWIALLAALQRRERIAGLIGIAPAPDFTDELIWKRMTADQQATMMRERVIYQPSQYSAQPYAITLDLIEDGRKHQLLGGAIPLTCPVRLLHGMQDPDVPWQRSLLLTEKLAATDVRVGFIKDGDHRLSRDQDLRLLCATVEELLQPR